MSGFGVAAAAPRLLPDPPVGDARRHPATQLYMERSLNEIYLAARAAIEAVLDRAGFRLAGESHYPDSFGSAHADYRGRHQRVRLVWYGKDRFLGLSVARLTNPGQHPAPDQWHSLEPVEATAPGQSLQPGPGAEGR